MHGFITLNKPYGESSNNALTHLRRLLESDKSGFAGTLDPFATGVLPVGLGRATRLLEFVQRQSKVYLAELTFGNCTDTGDLTGDLTETSSLPKIADIDTEGCIAQFSGEISQIPPVYSALKVDGERAYMLARKGIPPTLAARKVTVHQLEFVERTPSESDDSLLSKLTFRVNCSSGTYVRTLGEDIAHFWGSTGHLSALTRESVGQFTIEESWTLEAVEKALTDERKPFLLPIERGMGDLPQIRGSAELLKEVCLGKKPLAELHSEPPLPEEGDFALIDSSGELAAICRLVDNLIKPRKVFKPG